MRVRFSADFDYKPTSQVTIGYRAGMVMTVKRSCGERAIAAGKAVSADTNERPANGYE